MMQNYYARLESNRNFHDVLNNAGRTLLLITSCTRFAFTTLDPLALTMGLLQNKEMKLRGKAQLLTMCTS